MPEVVTIIQARTGSSRLPGKIMYPLGGVTVIGRVVRRVNAAGVGSTVVATSDEPRDDVLAQHVPAFGADVIRGNETDVLSRFETVVETRDPDIVVRVTADCPLLSMLYLRHAVTEVEQGADYVTAGINRSFPRGVTAEAFTADSFITVAEQSTEPRHHEHVTPYYREHPEMFDMHNVVSSTLFEDESYQDRTDLRLTLDEADDYRLLNLVFDRVEHGTMLPLKEAIDIVDTEGLATLNEHVTQKTVSNVG